jgi:Domain of unknown function (DUF4924)
MSIIPAQVKKEESIAEYIIHMYQTEDLILTYKFNLNEIFEYVIKHMSKDEKVLKKLLLWYADIIEQMKNEDIINTKRHLSSIQKYVDRLSAIHEDLLMKDLSYVKVYSKAEKDILHHIALSDNTITNPIQICLNGIYGMLLLKLNGKNVSAEQQRTLAGFGSILAYLSEAYKEKYEVSK